MAKSGDTSKVSLQGVVLGELAIFANPFEVFVENGLEPERRSPDRRTMVLGRADGYNGYLPTSDQHELVRHETWLVSDREQVVTSVILTLELLDTLANWARPR